MQGKKWIAIIAICCLQQAYALHYPLPLPGESLVGTVHFIQSQWGDTLPKLSRRFEMGYFEMIQANPAVSRHQRLAKNTPITVPSFFILPDMAPRDGIVVNLPEMRLYYYMTDRFEVLTEPVAIGRLGWKTPEVTTKIVEKIKDPIWRVPESIQLHSYEKNGDLLPDIMPPGPENPLGQYALRLGVWSILLHGTNSPTSIGQRISSGCIRLYPEDIEQLYTLVDNGTPVYIINQPYKVGWYRGHLYVEIHKPLLEDEGSLRVEQSKVYQMIARYTRQYAIRIDWQLVTESLVTQSGVPTRIDIN